MPQELRLRTYDDLINLHHLRRENKNTINKSSICSTSSVSRQGRLQGLTDHFTDPEVSTLHTLTNVQNSLFVPNLGRFLNRAPTYELTRRPTKIDEEATPQADIYKTLSRRRTRKDVPARFDAELHDENRPQKPQRSHSISSQLSDSHYAALPHGLSLDDWTDEDIAELDDHVRHMLHSRRERFRRGWKGFKKYISKRKPESAFRCSTVPNSEQLLVFSSRSTRC